MRERNRGRIDALLALERKMQEQARQAREAPGEGQSDLARMLQDVDAAAAARRRERRRRAREAVPTLVALAAVALAALAMWWLFR